MVNQEVKSFGGTK